MKVVIKTDIDAFPLVNRGKVRDIYEIDPDSLLIVTTDRMSAFDVIMNQPIPYKGVILNKITLFWMRRFETVIANHILEDDVSRFPGRLDPWKEELEGRSVIVRKAKPLPVECIVRGYLAGSGWKDYEKTGSLCGQQLRAGLQEASRLDPPIFTPSTKAELGQHDENISFARACALLGDEAAEKARLVSLSLYENGRSYAAEKGIIVADTKFELGFIDGKLHLIDEVLTPDSSRFWPEKEYMPGRPQKSFDKQFLRDWLKSSTWNMEPPPPDLPADVIKTTADRYRLAYTSLTGESFSGATTIK